MDQLISAYGFNSLYKLSNGSGSSVTIIDAYGTSNVFSLNSFFDQQGIPPLTNSSITVLYPFGKPLSSNPGWEIETDADIEMVHSLAPGAHIYLVVAPNSSYNFQSLNWSIFNVDSKIISISWGTEETGNFSFLNSILKSAFIKGISIIAATGDSGAYINGSLAVNFPAGSQYVLSVGGTSLSESNGNYISETGWNGSGGGVTQFSPLNFEPSYDGKATIPDVSFNAGTPVCLYNGTANIGVYGTSIAAPAWAALSALLYSYNTRLPPILPLVFFIYNRFGYNAFHQITQGCNGYYCANGTYNLVTGIGSPKLPQFFSLATNASLPLRVITPNMIVEINGKNYSSPFSIDLPYYSNVSLKVFPSNISGYEYIPSSLKINGLVYATSTTLLINTSYNISVQYILKYRLLIKNYFPGENLTQYLLPGSYNISIGKYLLYYNDSFHKISELYTPYNDSLSNADAFYSNSPYLNLTITSPLNVSIYWHSMNISKINSNMNCVEVNYDGMQFVLSNDYVFLHSGPLELKPCISRLGNEIYYFSPFYSNAVSI
ncbi:MAG: S8 family serine peptidase, partial [Conexivisphaerales archaeon]